MSARKTMSDRETIVCRCEDVTLADIRRVIAEGAGTADDIKRLTRAGMGLCQGRTCRHLILQELAAATGTPIEKLTVPTFRPPTRPVLLGVIAGASGTAAAGSGGGESSGSRPVQADTEGKGEGEGGRG